MYRLDNGATLIECEQVGDVFIVLAKTNNLPGEYVTWQSQLKTSDCLCCFWGHYYRPDGDEDTLKGLRRAMDDYERRLGELRNVNAA